MSEQTPQRPQHPPGDYGRDDDCSKPKPNPDPKPDPKPCPDPCPDPCSTRPPYGPPTIPADCCTRPDCCDKPKEGESWCTWDEVDDPCVRASAGNKWTKITCKCESSNAECKCNGWDCGSYPQGTCVPCEPCKGLPEPPDKPPDGDGDTPPGTGCGDTELRRRLGAVQKAIQDAQKKRDEAAADVKASQDSEKELNTLIASIGALEKSYSEGLHKLKCREDCLKGFHRDIAKKLDELIPQPCRDQLKQKINDELINAELKKCCVKSLEAKLTCTTKLAWEKQRAELQLQKAEEAFKAIKELPKWIGDQFTELEAIRDQIIAALADKDNKKKHYLAFYLFYWKFVPGLCKRFKLALCCCSDDAATPGADVAQGRDSGTPSKPAPHFGCVPGDWHPSQITVERLRELVCCALDVVNKRKQELRTIIDGIAALNQRIAAIKAQTPDPKALEDKIKATLDAYTCGASATTTQAR